MSAPTEETTRFSMRQNMRHNWIWELQTADHHVVNRSDTDFGTRAECVRDARARGFAPRG